MGTGPERTGATDTAERKLARTEALLHRRRTELAAVERDLAEAQARLGSTESARLLEANERLIIAALELRHEVDTASHALETLSRSAERDTLTGLPHRGVLRDRLAQALAFAKRRQTRFALLFLDLNDFKQINDSLGHAVGDEVIRVTAERLLSCVRDTDTVSRYGGDEFVVLLTEIAQADDATRVAEKMITALAAPTKFGDHVLRLTASIGISICPEDGLEAEPLIDRADAAMYRAKSEGPGSFVFRGTGASAQRLVNQPSIASLRRPLTRHEIAIVEHERRLSELQEANQHLVGAALDAQQLQAAAERSQRKQKSFLGVLAHELRNPLAPIRHAASALGILQPTPDILHRMQNIIERQVVHITRLVDDLLDASRIETGKLRLEMSPTDLCEVVNTAVEASRPAMDARLQTFTVQLPDDCPVMVNGDADRLVQVVGNLLNNASKYTPDAGTIGLFVEVEAESALLTVTDTGIGISAEALPTVFEPFAQDVHAVGFNGFGLGIGLTVVREIVEAHGGAVHARSGGRGHGSEFVVRFGPLLSPAGDSVPGTATRVH